MLDDYTSVGKIDVIGNLPGKSHFVGHKYAGHAVLRQVLDRHAIEVGNDLRADHPRSVTNAPKPISVSGLSIRKRGV